jgi:hypothetical protein
MAHREKTTKKNTLKVMHSFRVRSFFSIIFFEKKNARPHISRQYATQIVLTISLWPKDWALAKRNTASERLSKAKMMMDIL